ncbi:uncharacterized protein EV422DRAFT_359848 [Fimicolochytrium jonesii]|uniref:uncharacterized protein n=1 Tax=Fimicolochytrium jonesii TaxID=1396493 RepID=UPI0022FDB2D8|nr:uncharacterized protein EV422DRAFT_359848 [Fimicolochytrium jonesii]KAI8823546.1 hypothetical protein EV422DRAFT_359848 [Fimicolochytrium jonesii]
MSFTTRLPSLPLITLTLLVLLSLLRPSPSLNSSLLVLARKPKFGQDTNYGDYMKAAKYGRSHMHDGTAEAAAEAAAQHDTTPPPSEDPNHYSKESEQEDLFYFFSLADQNGDHYLDGHELRHTYTTGGGEQSTEHPPKEHRLPLEEVESMIDHTLLEDDIDGDGKISWDEYLASQFYHQKV